MQHGSLRQTFAIPAGSGDYAEDVMDIDDVAGRGGSLEVQALVESLAAGSVIELWVLRVDGVPGTDNDWINSGISWTETGLQDIVPLAGWRSQIRGKSGGSAGDSVVSVVTN